MLCTLHRKILSKKNPTEYATKVTNTIKPTENQLEIIFSLFLSQIGLLNHHHKPR